MIIFLKFHFFLNISLNSLYQKNENLKGIDLALLKVLNDLNTLKVCMGHVAEWLRRGLQILLYWFDSGRYLQKKELFSSKKKVSFDFYIPR